MTVEEVTARILDRDYRLSCPPDEKAALLAAVDQVDREMRAIRSQGKVANAERIAVLAALNLASRLVAGDARGPIEPEREPTASLPDRPVVEAEIARRIGAIDALLDAASVEPEASHEGLS